MKSTGAPLTIPSTALFRTAGILDTIKPTVVVLGMASITDNPWLFSFAGSFPGTPVYAPYGLVPGTPEYAPYGVGPGTPGYAPPSPYGVVPAFHKQ